MMSVEEYKESLKQEFEEYSKRNEEELGKSKQSLVGFFIFCLVVEIIGIILSFALPMAPLIDVICEVDGFILGVIVILYFYTSFKTNSYPKKVLAYLLEEMKFDTKPSISTKETFMRNLTNYGFTALFVRINEKIYCFEVKLNEDKTVGDCIINFKAPMKLDEFLNYEIDGMKIGDMEQFEVLSINFGEALNFNAK